MNCLEPLNGYWTKDWTIFFSSTNSVELEFLKYWTCSWTVKMAHSKRALVREHLNAWCSSEEYNCARQLRSYDARSLHTNIYTAFHFIAHKLDETVEKLEWYIAKTYNDYIGLCWCLFIYQNSYQLKERILPMLSDDDFRAIAHFWNGVEIYGQHP